MAAPPASRTRCFLVGATTEALVVWCAQGPKHEAHRGPPAGAIPGVRPFCPGLAGPSPPIRGCRARRSVLRSRRAVTAVRRASGPARGSHGFPR